MNNFRIQCKSAWKGTGSLRAIKHTDGCLTGVEFAFNLRKETHLEQFHMVVAQTASVRLTDEAETAGL